MRRLKHDFVFLGSDWDLYKYAYSDLEKIDNATYVAGISSRLNRCEKFLFRAHFTPKINNYINLPFKSIWNKVLFRGLTDVDETIFVLDSGWILLNEEMSIINYLKRKCKKSKFVWFLQDLFCKQHLNDGSPIELLKIQKSLDLIVSFDQGDSEKYGFEYHPLVFSEFNGIIEEMPYSDVYFLGQAKDRLNDLLSVYKYLRDNGLKCDFHIAKVSENEQKYSDEIDYNPQFSYNKNLQHILHTKCLLEVMQKGGTGMTQRGVETVGLNKLLITNNTRIHEAPFYNPDFICQYNKPNEIPISFINKIKEGVQADYNYKEFLSPVAFFQFIEEKIYK